MTYMPPFAPEASSHVADRDDHGWIVAHMIGLIEYCEAAGLGDAERCLTEATERLAPILNGHRLARLRARAAEAETDAEPELRPAATVLEMSSAGMPLQTAST